MPRCGREATRSGGVRPGSRPAALQREALDRRTLVERANRRGYWATCNRDRSLLGAHDKALHRIVVDEEAVFVTNDEADFDALYRQVDLHTGLLILPQAERREALWPLLDAALDYIEQQANDEDEAPAEWMLNKRVEIDLDGSIKHVDLPSAE